jgi:hypothetical protein
MWVVGDGDGGEVSKIYFLEIGGIGGAPALRDDSLAVLHVRITTTTASAYQMTQIHPLKLTIFTFSTLS